MSATTENLSKLLADTYALALKTQNFHWNVEGPQFAALHVLFEQQYTELHMAVDAIAERLKAKGEHAPGGFAEYARLTVIEDAAGQLDAKAMVAQLAADNRTLAKTAHSLRDAAEEAGDPVTVGMAEGRMEVHEKAAWMLSVSAG